jgi:4-hydroxy-2-oxoheptanedioate aldolase
MSVAFAERLRSGGPLVGTVLSIPGVALAELAAAPFDLVWIDMEHGALSLSEAQELVVAAQGTGCAAAIRIPHRDAEVLPAVLDAGVDAVVVPDLRSADEARELVARLRYPPDGSRGFGPRRAGHHGRAERFWATPEARPALLVQIESRVGVEAAPAIATVPGIDALVAGASDLSFDLGVPLQLAAPPVVDAVDAVRAAASTAGVAFGLAGSGDPTALAALAGPDASLVMCSVDVRLYASAVDAVAGALRATLSAHQQAERDVRA